VGDQRHAPAALSPGKKPVTHCTGGWWAPGPVWTGAENLATTWIRSPDRQPVLSRCADRGKNGYKFMHGCR